MPTGVSAQLEGHLAGLLGALADQGELARRAAESGLERLRAALEERLEAFATYQHEQLVALDERLDGLAGGVDLSGRVDALERLFAERLVELEARVRDEHGNRLAEVEAALGRTGVAIDESLAALSGRLAALGERLEQATTARREEVRLVVDEAVHHELSGVRGELELVRIDLDRLRAEQSDAHDRLLVRLGDLEARSTDRIDVNAAVHVERLDEIERQLIALDPGTRRARQAFADAADPHVAAPPAGTVSHPSAPVVAVGEAPPLRSFGPLFVLPDDTAPMPPVGAVDRLAPAPPTPATPSVPRTRTIAAPPSMRLGAGTPDTSRRPADTSPASFDSADPAPWRTDRSPFADM